MILTKILEAVVTQVANVAWTACAASARRAPAASFQPKWAPAPLLKSWETIVAGARLAAHDRFALPDLRARSARAHPVRRRRRRDPRQRARRRDQGAHPRARRQDRRSRRPARRTAPSPTRWRSTRRSSTRIERLFPGRDFRAVTDTLHNHGTSSIKYGRGAVLTIDLTNRCNMMCDPCFMDANQVGYVHELTLDEVKQLLDDAISDQAAAADDACSSPAASRRSRRSSSTRSPTRARSATSACRRRPTASASRRIPEFATAGARGRPAHRLPAVRRRRRGRQRAPQGRQPVRREAARDREPARAPASTSPRRRRSSTRSTTIRSGRSSSSRSRTATRSASSRSSRCRSPAATRTSTTTTRARAALHAVAPGRGREAPDRRHRAAARLVPALGRRARSSDVTDLMQGPGRRLGHDEVRLPSRTAASARRSWSARRPRSGRRSRSSSTSSASSRTRSAIADAGRGPRLTQDADRAEPAAQLHAVDARRRASGCVDLLKKFDKQSGGALGGSSARRADGNRKSDEWLLLFVAGMWFQDLWTYDFRRTEMCIIPYATQMGEISFCAYNTGVGWRQIVEKMHQNATVAEWYKEHGKHARLRQPAEGRAAADPTAAQPADPEHSALIPLSSLRSKPRPAAAPTVAQPVGVNR